MVNSKTDLKENTKIIKERIEKIEDYESKVQSFSCNSRGIDYFLKKEAYSESISSKSTTHLLLRNNEILAFYTYALKTMTEDENCDNSLFYIELKYLAIRKEQQRRKIGTIIMKDIIIPEVKDICNKLGIINGILLVPINEPARSFYEKLGFKLFRVETDMEGIVEYYGLIFS